LVNRQEAVNLLKEISDKCPAIAIYSIALMPPDSDDVLSHGFQIRIWGDIGQEISCLNPILEKSHLGVKALQEKKIVVIYRPMKA
jgi:hypothetical protein